MYDLHGQRFGRWLVIGPRIPSSRPEHRRQPQWLCRCDCGTERYVDQPNLIQGLSRGCHCERDKRMASQNVTHEATRKGNESPEYRAWKEMRRRCFQSKTKSFADYGGRGIRICPRWNSYACFLEDMGPRPTPSHTLERQNVNGDYTPENCCWATRTEQANNKRDTRYIEHNGERRSLAEWNRFY